MFLHLVGRSDGGEENNETRRNAQVTYTDTRNIGTQIQGGTQHFHCVHTYITTMRKTLKSIYNQLESLIQTYNIYILYVQCCFMYVCLYVSESKLNTYFTSAWDAHFQTEETEFKQQ